MRWPLATPRERRLEASLVDHASSWLKYKTRVIPVRRQRTVICRTGKTREIDIVFVE